MALPRSSRRCLWPALQPRKSIRRGRLHPGGTFRAGPNDVIAPRAAVASLTAPARSVSRVFGKMPRGACGPTVRHAPLRMRAFLFSAREFAAPQRSIVSPDPGRTILCSGAVQMFSAPVGYIPLRRRGPAGVWDAWAPVSICRLFYGRGRGRIDVAHRISGFDQPTRGNVARRKLGENRYRLAASAPALPTRRAQSSKFQLREIQRRYGLLSM